MGLGIKVGESGAGAIGWTQEEALFAGAVGRPRLRASVRLALWIWGRNPKGRRCAEKCQGTRMVALGNVPVPEVSEGEGGSKGKIEGNERRQEYWGTRKGEGG